MNKKVKPTEDYNDFLPDRVKESEKLDQSEKNVLATLCYHRLNYSIYAEEHNGWFYSSQKEIEEGSGLSHMQTNRVLLKLIIKRIIERKSGTNHRCTHYRLHPAIDKLLPKNPEGETVNDTLAITEGTKSANDTLDKNRLDESRKDESRIVEENVVSEAALGEAASSQKNVKDVLLKFKENVYNVKSREELETLKRQLLNSGISIPEPYHELADEVFNTYRIKFALLK